MAKKKIKQNSKVIMEQKRRKRRLLTLWRIVKYGFNSFRRNAWLSVAATAIMTITLTIIFSSFLARMAITNTIDSLTEKIGVSIYLKKDNTNTVIASDYHIGFTGGASSNNTYTLTVPIAGVYTLRYFGETKTERIKSGKYHIYSNSVK